MTYVRARARNLKLGAKVYKVLLCAVRKPSLDAYNLQFAGKLVNN